jgi:HSP20 family protein
MANRNNLPELFSGSFMHPFRDLSRLQRRIDRIFDEMLDPFSRGGEALMPSSIEQIGFVPPMDIEETPSHYLVAFDLPGISKDEIKIDVKDNTLVVSGERRREKKAEGGAQVQERYYGMFQRSFTLPADVKADAIEANCSNGVLQIAIPKAEPAKGRSIQIKDEHGGIFNTLLAKEGKAKEEKKEKAA